MSEISINEIIQLFDKYLTTSGKQFLTIENAIELLKLQFNDEFGKVDIKNLIESNQIPHAYQTLESQWRIPHSNSSIINPQNQNLLIQDSKERPFIKENRIKRNFLKPVIFFTVVIMIIVFYFKYLVDEKPKVLDEYSFNNSYNNATIKILNKKLNDIETNKTSSFVSKYNIKEENNNFSQTNLDITYHIFDLTNKFLIFKSTINEQLISEKFHIYSYSKNKKTMFIKINSNKLKEVQINYNHNVIIYYFKNGVKITYY